ncbi:MAG: TetR/AcrR family transcriptional regulator, partial [Solirubrobacterales bacterium]|nr:TetR/AcrR family transcriptional regulator [Solirubrobacterales bacterium]
GRAQILTVATAEFAARGYAAASMNVIAENAGITKPVIYGHFESKDGLYLECVRAVGSRLEANVESAMLDSGPTAGMALAVIDAIFKALAPDPKAWLLLTDTTVPDGPLAEAANGHLTHLTRLGRDGTAAVVAAAGGDDADDLALAARVWVSTVSAVVHWWIEHPQWTADEMTARCRRLLGAVPAG